MICAVFFYLCVPEMKGRSLEELDELFENCVSVKKFRNYHTRIQDDAVHDVQASMGAFMDKGPTVTELEETNENKVET